MSTIKHLVISGLILCMFQSANAQTQKDSKQDSLVIANFNKKAKKEVLTTAYVNERKDKNKKPLTTLAVYYDPKPILTLARHD